jgi:hypothetical protein
MRGGAERGSLGSTRGGVMEEVFWTIVVYAFVVGVLATAAYSTYRIFGGGHRHQH